MVKYGSFRCIFLLFLALGLVIFSFKDSGYSTTASPGVSVQSHPRGIAIHPEINAAAIAVGKEDADHNPVSGYAAIVDLETQRVISEIPVGKEPCAVAIDREMNMVLVSNSKDNSVSAIDLNSHSVVKTVPVGKEPTGIAIDPSTHTALVANHKDDTVSIIELTTLNAVGAITVGKEPKDVAIDPLLKLAFVVNEKDYSVSVIDLNTYRVTGTIALGKQPQAIDINPETHLAVVINDKDNSVTVINLLTWHTNTIPVGKHPTAVAVNSLDNSALVISDEDRSLFLIDLNANTVVRSYSLNKEPKGIAVNNYTNIAGIIDDKTDSLTLLQLPNPIPVIRSINPDTLIKGSKDLKVKIEGSKFIKSSTVAFQSTIASYTVNPIFIDNHNLEVALPDEMLKKTATYQTTIINPGPDGGISNPVNLQINNPVPTITVLDPAQAMAGTPAVTLNIYGTGFVGDTSFYLNGIPRPFTLISQTKIRIELTTEDLEVGKYLEVTASNPPPGGGLSKSIKFTILNPVPALTLTNPQTIIAGSPTFTITLTGNNFVKTSLTSFNNQTFPIRYNGKIQIEATIPADTIKTPGSYPVKIINPSPGGGESSYLTFVVKPPLEVKITSPGNGETINKAKVIVKGTFKSDTKDIGITVNGIIAEIKGNDWVANDLPLTVRSNTITATIKDSSDNSANASVVINTNDVTQAVRLSANITSGIAPLTTYFSVTTETTNPISSYQMDFEGDGVIDYTGATFEDISHTYTTEGFFYPTIIVTDNQGNTFSDRIAITVLNKTEIDTLLKGKWEGMKGALKNKDVEGALGYFVERSKERYGQIFAALKDQLPIIVNTFIEFNITDVYENVAEYEIVANEGGVLYSYPGSVIKDSNGIWKFKDF